MCDPSAVDGVAFNAAKRSGLDVLTPGWLHDCVEHARILTPRPKHRLHLSRATVERSEGRIDAFGDDHLVDVDSEDLVRLVRGDRVVNAARQRLDRRRRRQPRAGDGGGVRWELR